MAERATALAEREVPNPAAVPPSGGGTGRSAGPRGGVSGRGPAGLRRSPSTSRRAPVRLPELVLGVVLVAGGALAAVLWAGRQPTERIVVADRAIQRGETIEATMLRWAEVSGDPVSAVADPALVAGRIAAVDLAAGAPLLVSAVREPTPIGPGQVEYGMALDPGDFPVGLAVGDRVVVVAVPPPDETGTAADPVIVDPGAEVLVAPLADLAPGARAVLNLVVVREALDVLATAVEVRLARLPEPGAGSPTPAGGIEPGAGRGTDPGLDGRPSTPSTDPVRLGES